MPQQIPREALIETPVAADAAWRAGRLGLRAGMTQSEARSRCAELITLPWDDVTIARAVTKAGSDKACVSMPRKSGPSMPSLLRCTQIACVTARMWASLNEPLKADPRCPDVPNVTRCAGLAGSGRSLK